MTDVTDPVDAESKAPFHPANEAASSVVGPRADDRPEPLPGTDAMGSETGGLAGTSR
jgi:hypothetical protein